MQMTSLLTALLAVPITGLAANAAPSSAISIAVRETAGIRRGNFPSRAVVPLASGALRDPARVRLLDGEQEVPLQAAVLATWPDGSVRELELDFNVSIDALSGKEFRLELGELPKPVITERLIVHESDGGLQVGRVRFGSERARLIQSVAFGSREVVGGGSSGFVVTTHDGAAYLLEPDGVEVTKAGPIAAQVRYTGVVPIGSRRLPFTITLSVPNAKSWVKYSVNIADPLNQVRYVAFTTSLSFGAFPWSWDFGTGSRSYGALRAPGDAVTLAQSVVWPGAADWQIRARNANAEWVQERAAGARPTVAEGWGHLEGGDRALAFAVEHFAREPGEYSIVLAGDGQLEFRFAPSDPGGSHSFAVYQHYVSVPISIGAATSPVAMSTPLEFQIR
jgi:exo-rhamnogalacturonan lyase-like protein